MGFFSALFRKPIVAEDEFFGRLVREPCHFSDSRYCWYAESVLFSPTNTAIECMIDAEINSPLTAQRAFYRNLEKQYTSILPKINSVVELDSRLLHLGQPITDFKLTRRFAGLTIPHLTNEPVQWELWFEPINDYQWGYTVTVDMIDNVPQPGIGISA